MQLAKILLTVVNCYKHINGGKQTKSPAFYDQQGSFQGINGIYHFYKEKGISSKISGSDVWWLLISLLIIASMARYGVLTSSFKELFIR